MIRWLRGIPSGSSDASAPPFRAGQVWRYRTRPGEDGSLLHVLLAERHDALGEVVHVRVDGLRIANPVAPGETLREIGHMPFGAAAVRRSVTEIVEEGAGQADPGEGYQTWKEAFGRGEAGVFTVAVAEAVEVMEAALRG